MQFLIDTINWLCKPEISFPLSCVALAAVLLWEPGREWFGKKRTIVILQLSMLGFVVVSAFNPTFLSVISKGDNIPIVAMLFLVLFFTWLYVHKACINDKLIAEGKDVENKAESKQLVYTWPDLVFSEFICTIVLWCVLLGWSILIPAPLEEPANPVDTPNPSKAPWYFLGLQEMLVYYDPWLAGVVFPGLIIVGLIVLPFIDTNPKGNGYYTYKERPFAISTFMFGFLILWIVLIIYGTFLRGPNWNFFGPYEYWDTHKLELLTNVNLSEYMFRDWGLNGGKMPDNIFLREGVGMILCVLYFVIPTYYLKKKWMAGLYKEMGGPRFYIMVGLFLTMMSLPIKMVLRWVLNLKYIVAIPEYFFNI